MHSYLWDEELFTYKKILSRELILVRVEFLLGEAYELLEAQTKNR